MHGEQIKTICNTTYSGPQKGHLLQTNWPGLHTSLFSLSNGSKEPPDYINQTPSHFDLENRVIMFLRNVSNKAHFYMVENPNHDQDE